MSTPPKTTSIWGELSKPFPTGTVGKLPKINCSECTKVLKDRKGRSCSRHQVAKCVTCGNYMTEAHIHLDYVGHAAVTDRLNSVDPTWTWEPVATDPQGAPALDREGNLWIRLTVGGVTRLGVGDGNNMKERVGDAIRNAAMRFGVALDLWTKEELETHIESPELKNEKPADQPNLAYIATGVSKLTEAQVAELMQLAKGKGYQTKEAAVAFLNEITVLDDFRSLDPTTFGDVRRAILEHRKEAA